MLFGMARAIALTFVMIRHFLAQGRILNPYEPRDGLQVDLGEIYRAIGVSHSHAHSWGASPAPDDVNVLRPDGADPLQKLVMNPIAFSALARLLLFGWSKPD